MSTTRTWARWAAVFFSLVGVVALSAQTPQPQSSPLYERLETIDGTSFVLGGKTYGPYEHIAGTPAFSPSFTSWMITYQTSEPGHQFVFNGQTIPFKKNVQYSGDWILSDDGKHFVGRVVLEGDQNSERDYLMVDGQTIGPFFQMDIRTIGTAWYAVGNHKDQKAGRTLMLGGKSFGPYDDVRETAQDPVSGEVVAQAFKKDKAFLVTQGKESGPYQRIQFLRDDAGQFLGGFVLENPGTTSIVYGGKTLGPYDQMGMVVVTGESKTLMFSANKKGQAVFVKDGKETAVEWSDIYRTSSGVVSVLSNKGRSFLNDGVKDYGPYTGIRERYFPDKGLWAIAVEVRKGDSSRSYIVTPVGQFPGDTLRSDGKTYSWISVDDEGKASVNRLPVLP